MHKVISEARKVELLLVWDFNGDLTGKDGIIQLLLIWLSVYHSFTFFCFVNSFVLPSILLFCNGCNGFNTCVLNAELQII